MITFVSFQRPVNFTSVGTEYWSSTDSKFRDVTCEDKGNHLLFTTTVQGKARRVRVPLTNISQVTEEGDLKTKKEP